MAHQYKVGDRIRIKKREDYCNLYPFPFVDSMNKLAGTICEIKAIKRVESFTNPNSGYINDDYHMYEIRPVDSSDHRDFVWAWHSSMFEPVLENSEQKIQTLVSLHEGDLVEICGMIGSIDGNWGNSSYYLDFDGIRDEQEHFACCRKLRELVPDFEKIANEFDAIRQEADCFPVFSTIDNLVKFAQAVNNVYNSKKSITTPKTLNENEIKFQKPKAAFSRGSVPKGNPICGRKHKTAIVVGHLSNQEISC
jgi:hypothetical protein